MLVTPHNGELFLVAQNDHGILTGDLAETWGNAEFEALQPTGAMVTAARMHDIGWVAPDAEPLLNSETRRPTHVTEVDLNAHQGFYAEGVATVLAEDRYAGLLVGLHWTGLYRGRWGLGPAFDPERSRAAGLDRVVEEQEASWIGLRHQLIEQQSDRRRSVFEQRLWWNYDLLQALDLMSIFLCTAFAGTEMGVPAVPAAGGESRDVALVALDDETARFDPYPFATDRLELSISGRWIPDRDYDEQADLRAVVEAAEPVTRSWSIVP
jgi:hypothetical protein